MAPLEVFEKVLDPGTDRWTRDHRVAGNPVLAGAVALDMALAAGALLRPGEELAIAEAVFLEPLVLGGGAPRRLALSLEATPDGFSFELVSDDLAEASPARHLRGRLKVDGGAPQPLEVAGGEDLQPLAAEAYYRRCGEQGLDYGPRFRPLAQLRRSRRHAVAQLDAGEAEDFLATPVLLDGALQTLAALTPAHRETENGTAGSSTPVKTLPFSVGRVRLAGPLPRRLRAVAEMLEAGTGGLYRGRVALVDDGGHTVASLDDVCLRVLGAGVAAGPHEERRNPWLHRLRWQPVAPPSATAADPAGDDGAWLVMRESGPWSAALVEELRASGRRVLELVLGEAPLAPDRHPLDPASGDALAQAVTDALTAAGGDRRGDAGEISRALFLCAAEAPEEAAPEAEQQWTATRTWALLALARGLVAGRPPVPLDIVTRAAVAVREGELPIPAAATAWGAARALVWELPNLGARRLDLEREDGLPQLLRALASGAEEVALRDGEPWQPSLTAEPAPAPVAGLGVRAGAAYLISGGFGGIGLVLAEHLARRGAGTLYLLSRRGLEGADDATAARLATLEAAGTRVVALRADLGDESSLAAALTRLDDDGIDLDGVFHSAGVTTDGLVLRKSFEAVQRTLWPKVLGTLRLLAETDRRRPRFTVLFSSASAVFGNLGQTDYAAANAWLDQLAHRRSAQGRTTVAIDWSLWREVGMGVDLVATIARRGFRAIDNAEATEVLDRVLAAGGPQWVVFQPEGEGPRAAVLAAPTSGSAAAETPEPAATTARGPEPGAERSRLRAVVLAALESHLRLGPGDVDHDAPFLSYGVDSIIAVDLVRTLEGELGAELPPTLFFEYGTVSELVDGLAERYAVPAAEPVAAPVLTEPVLEEPVTELAVTELAATAPPEADGSDEHPENAVAVIGMAGRFPGADSIDAFWRLLSSGEEVLSPAPERWPGAARAAAGSPRWAGYLAAPELFDPGFFNISPKEARSLDPQQRLALELAWETLEDAGRVPQPGGERHVGVFLGASYQHFRDGLGLGWVDSHSALGNHNAILANRLSYFLDLQGPCLTVDTLCSSSLVALHLAVASLRRGECRLALVGGVHVGLSEWYFRSLGQLRATSPDGRCKTFDEGADGYTPGEGGAMVLLKPLTQALADGDRIHGVIRGTAVNHGGRASGLTVPRIEAQAAVVRAALDDAACDPRRIVYLEAHGTGTALGDPIEVEALQRAFGEGPPQTTAIGSVKAQIGHLEPAAGIAGLVKVLCLLRHRQLPPARHLVQPNHRIRFEGSPFYLNDRRRVLPPGTAFAGVSSFGMGGVNAHAVVAEAPRATAAAPPVRTTARLLKLSARTADALDELAARYAELGAADPRDVCFSANTGRGDFEHRRAVLLPAGGELPAALAGDARSVRGNPEQRGDEVSLHRALRALDDPAAALLRSWCGGAAFEDHLATLLPAARASAAPAVAAEALSEESWQRLLEAVARVWAQGARVRWDAFEEATARREGTPPRRIGLPTYPFQRRAIPLPPTGSGAEGMRLHRYLDRALPDLDGAAFESRWAVAERAWLADHRYQGRELLPLAALVAQVQAAVELVEGSAPAGCEIRDLELRRGTPVEEAVTVRLELRRGEGEALAFSFAADEGELARGSVRTLGAIPEAPQDSPAAGLRELVPAELYAWFAERGMDYGPSLRVIRELRHDGATVDATLAAAEPVALLDGALQAIGAVTRAHGHGGPLPLPVAAERLVLGTLPEDGARVTLRVETHRLAEGRLRADLVLRDLEGRPQLVIEGLSLRAAEIPAPAATAELTSHPAPAPAADPRRALEELRRIVAERLEMLPSEVEAHRPFLELGVDSIAAVDMVERLGQLTGKPLPGTLFFDYGTPRELAEALAGHLAVRWPERSEAGAGPAADPEVPAPPPAPRRIEIVSAGPALGGGREEVAEEPEAPVGAIAVIGAAGRFPGADDLESFWRNLVEGRDAVSEIPVERWDWRSHFDADPNAAGRTYSRWGGFLRDFDGFDNELFGFFPREAEAMDPQQRLLLETVWAALENAARTPAQLARATTGVFVAASYHHYRDYHVGPLLDAYTGLGNHNALLANRVSYHYDFTGPSFTVDTLCSSSLVALQLAVRALRDGECDYALVAGVHAGLSPFYYQNLSRLRALSPEGRCKTFGAGADGYVPGEGVGVLLLKPLSRALADGDVLRGVIRGVAVNHGGRGSGLTVPNGRAQEKVIRAALADAGVSADSLGYVEAHGTGTRLGDPIEVAALNRAFRADTEAEGFCALGSVKSNIGHLEPAAGVAGVLKTLMALERGTIPPTLHVGAVNPECELEGSPFRLALAAEAWPAGDDRRRAGVSSFGMGGVNAHVVLEQAPAPRRTAPAEAPGAVLWTFSARDEETLGLHLDDVLALEGSADAADLAFSLARGRHHHRQRLALSAPDAAGAWHRLREARRRLAGGESPAGEGVAAGRCGDEPPRIAFLFSGQGAQVPAMGRALYAADPVFRAAIDDCAELLREPEVLPLRALLGLEQDADPERIHLTGYAQPALFAFGYALAALWRSWGVVPDLLLGHSVGEVTAACVAGAVSLEDGLRLIRARARCMQALPAGAGAMAAVRCGHEILAARLGGFDGLALAAVNGPEDTVISGRRDQLEELLAQLEAEGVRTVPLKTSHAFHSPLMEPALDEIEAAAASMRFTAPALPLVSNLDGGLHAGAPDARYWREHARRPVAFGAGVETLLAEGATVLLEIGPKAVLTGMASRVAGSRARCLASLAQGPGDVTGLDRALAELFTLGVEVEGCERFRAGRRISLPAYPFRRRSFRLPAATPALLTATEPGPAETAALGFGLYRPAWEPVAGAGGPAPRGRLLLVDGGAPEPGEVAALLRRAGLETVQIAAGDELETVLRDLGGDLAGIAFLVGAAESHELLFRLAQALAPREREAAAGTTPVLVLDGVLGDGGLRGLTRALAAEGRRHRWRLVEVEAGSEEPAQAGAEARARAILDELRRETGTAVVRRRGAERLRPTWEPVPAPAPGAAPGPRRGGVYVITGGLGGVGLEMARHLAAVHGVRLVLAGRSPLPPREAWDESTDEAVRARIAALRELEAAGAEVLYVAVDVAREEGVRELYRRAVDRFGALHGVIHAAGVAARPGSLAGKSLEDLRRVRGPKAVAARWLVQHAPRQDFDGVFLCSSVAGSHARLARGLGDYALANAELDGFARRHHEVAVRSLVWPAWEDTGLAKGGPELAREGGARDLGLGSLTPAQGVAALVAAWSSPEPVLLVAPEPFSAATFAATDGASAPAVHRPEAAPAVSDEREAGDGTREPHRERVLDAFRAVLKTDRIDTGRDFAALGLDSLILADLASALEGRYGRPVEPGWLLQHPSVERLVTFFAEQWPEVSETALASPPALDHPESVEPAADDLSHELSQILARLDAGELSVDHAALLLEPAS